jgi:hypothetical protein
LINVVAAVILVGILGWRRAVLLLDNTLSKDDIFLITVHQSVDFPVVC